MRKYICLPLLLVILFITATIISCTSRDAPNSFGYTQFFSKATFLPSNYLSQLSEAEKTWFSSNIFDLQWRITDKAGGNSEQETNVRNRISSMLKTFNYTVYTRAFAEAMQSIDGGSYLVNSNNVADSPNSISVLLALRSINSRNFDTGELKVILVSDLKSSGVTDGEAVLNADTDEVFNNSLIDIGAWDFWSNKEVNQSILRLNMDRTKYQGISKDEFYICSDNESALDGVFSYRDFVRAFVQTIFDWEDTVTDGTLMLDAVADAAARVTCEQLIIAGIDKRNPPFKDVNFDALKYLGYIN